MNLRKIILRLDAASKAYNTREDFENDDNIFLAGYGILLNTYHCYESVAQYSKSFDNGEQLAPLGLDLQLFACKDKLLNCHRLYDDLKVMGDKSLDKYGFKFNGNPIPTANDLLILIEENIGKFRAQFDEVYNRVLHASDAMYEKFYKDFTMGVDMEQLKLEFDIWKMNRGDIVMEDLVEKQVLEVANILKRGPLRFVHAPTKREINKSKLDAFCNLLPDGYKLPADFDKIFTKFLHNATWDGYMVKINRAQYGRYIFSEKHRLTLTDLRNLATLDARLQLIHREMAKLMPDDECNNLTPARREIANKLYSLAERGEWIRPACSDAIKRMLSRLMNDCDDSLVGEELKMSEMFWSMLESGRSDRVKIVWLNLVGFFDDMGYFNPSLGSPALCTMFYGNDEGYTNIDKGRPTKDSMHKNLKSILPLLQKYKP